MLHASLSSPAGRQPTSAINVDEAVVAWIREPGAGSRTSSRSGAR